MADLPKYEDKIVAGPGGAILYSYSTGETWNWDRKPVVLPEGQYLHSTGSFHNNPTLGLMYEVYQWRVNGKVTGYRTKEEARASLGLIVNFTGINRETKWVTAAQTRVEFDTANTDNAPDPTSPSVKEKTEKERVEADLKTVVYDKNPAQLQHTSLVKNSEGKWILTFANGYSVDYVTFLGMTTLERQNAAKVNLASGLTDTPGTGGGTTDTKTETFPVWAYALVGVLVTALLGLFVLSKPKTKKK